jgi:hypothetical protein
MSAYILARDSDSCPECGEALCSRACRSCEGAAASWFSICEECGGRAQLLSCPNRASHAPSPCNRGMAERSYWFGREGQLSNPFLCGSGAS